MQQFILGDDIVLKIKVPRPEMLYTLHLRKNSGGAVLYSRASFYPDADLFISTAVSYAIAGSYSGVDVGGLFWSLRPIGANDASPLPPLLPTDGKTVYQVDVELEGAIIYSNGFVQIHADGSISATPLTGDLKGTYYSGGSASGRGLLFLHGSGGADEETKDIAGVFALHGYNTLLLEYGEDERLEEFPLEYFSKAAAWLSARSAGPDHKILVHGISKGGEAALLLAEKYPRLVAAVCACSPLTAPYQSINRARPPHIDPRSSWTHEGESVPFMPMLRDIPTDFASEAKIDLFPVYCGVFKDRAAAFGMTMDVSLFDGPILLLSGQDDRMTPSSAFCDLFIEKNPGKNIQHKSWPDAGHVIGWPGYQEVYHFFHGPFLIGGTDRGNGKAARKSWKEILRFFGENR